MKKLLLSLGLMLAVLIGSTGVSHAGDRSSIKPLDNQITIGNADYNNATTTINLNIVFRKDPTKISLSFQHSLKSQEHSRTFSLKLLNCTFSGFPESTKANSFCQLAKNTNLTFTKFNSKNLLEIKFLNAVFGSTQLDLRSNSDLTKMNFTGSLTNLKNPLLSMYKKLNGYINTNNLKGEVVLIKKNGEELRESAAIKNNQLYRKGSASGDPISSKQVSLINNHIKAFRDILKSDEYFYYFGGNPVDQGKILNAEITSLWNIIQPSPLAGYTVLGTKKYLDRQSIVVKPHLDLNRLPNTIKSQLKVFGITFGQNDLVYIDQLLGIPTFWKQTIEGRTNNTIGTLTNGGMKFGLTKEGKLCSQLGGISDLSAKCYPKWQIEVLATTALPKTTKSSAPSNDIQSRLSKLKKLLDAGLITKEEAAKKRNAILDSL